MRKLFFAAILLILVIILLNSCVKSGEYVQKPTCFRYLELSDTYNGEMIYLKTDTIYQSNRYGQKACNDDTAIFYTTYPLTGCAGGWQQFRYIKQSY